MFTPQSERPETIQMALKRHFHPRDKDLVKSFQEAILRNGGYILTPYIFVNRPFWLRQLSRVT